MTYKVRMDVDYSFFEAGKGFDMEELFRHLYAKHSVFLVGKIESIRLNDCMKIRFIFHEQEGALLYRKYEWNYKPEWERIKELQLYRRHDGIL